MTAIRVIRMKMIVAALAGGCVKMLRIAEDGYGSKCDVHGS